MKGSNMAGNAPNLYPGGAGSSGADTEHAGGASPSLAPPAFATGKGDCGCDSSSEGFGAAESMLAPPGMSDSAPALVPAAEGIASGGITAWHNNKRITGLWGINQNRNSWVYIEGLGWRRLAASSDSAIQALTVAAAHAREKNAPVNYREEADGLIHELYVF
jgi:hypothetical protein